jgi:hypothetical protein
MIAGKTNQYIHMKHSELSMSDSNIRFSQKTKKRGSHLLPLLLVFLTALVGALVIVGGIMLLAFVLS